MPRFGVGSSEIHQIRGGKQRKQQDPYPYVEVDLQANIHGPGRDSEMGKNANIDFNNNEAIEDDDEKEDYEDDYGMYLASFQNELQQIRADFEEENRKSLEQLKDSVDLWKQKNAAREEEEVEVEVPMIVPEQEKEDTINSTTSPELLLPEDELPASMESPINEPSSELSQSHNETEKEEPVMVATIDTPTKPTHVETTRVFPSNEKESELLDFVVGETDEETESVIEKLESKTVPFVAGKTEKESKKLVKKKKKSKKQKEKKNESSNLATGVKSKAKKKRKKKLPSQSTVVEEIYSKEDDAEFVDAKDILKEELFLSDPKRILGEGLSQLAEDEDSISVQKSSGAVKMVLVGVSLLIICSLVLAALRQIEKYVGMTAQQLLES